MRFLLELRTRGGPLFQSIYGKRVNRKDFTCTIFLIISTNYSTTGIVSLK